MLQPEHARACQDRAAQQPLLALERANRVRSARAELKRKLGCGELNAAEAILRNARETQTMAIADLLLSQRGWGPRRSGRLLRSLTLHEHKTLGSLTKRQRVMLAGVLAGGIDRRAA
jgi:hypothetical protein